jgi:hypothetical protein
MNWKERSKEVVVASFEVLSTKFVWRDSGKRVTFSKITAVAEQNF